MQTKRIIYQSAFEVESPVLGKDDRKLEVFSGVCKWMKEKYPSFKTSAVDLGGAVDWRNDEGHDFVARRMVISSGDYSGAVLYYMTLRHPDDRLAKFKTWVTEIGVSVLDDRVYFSLQLSTLFSSDFIGEARAQEARPPRLIEWLVSRPSLVLRRGDYAVSKEPKTLGAGDFSGFFDRLEQYSNGMAKVVVKGSEKDVDRIATALSHSLIGVAEVYCVMGDDFETEVANVLADYDDQGAVVSYTHRFQRNAISVLRPGNGVGDWKNHMVYRKSFDERNAWKRVGISLNRSGFGFLRKTLKVHCFELADLERLYRQQDRKQLEAKMAEFRKRGLDKEQQELWKELEALSNQSDKLGEVEAERDGLWMELEGLQSEVDTLTSRVEYSENERKRAADRVERGEKEFSKFVDGVFPVPKKEVDLAAYFERLYPFVHFAKEALGTAADTRGLSHVEWLNVFQRLFKALPSVSQLHGAAMDKALHIATGWDCTSSEGSMTKSDKKFMKMRTFKFQSENRVCLPHLKKDRARIYFCIEGEQIYIGHAGRHLDTAGTKRGSHV